MKEGLTACARQEQGASVRIRCASRRWRSVHALEIGACVGIRGPRNSNGCALIQRLYTTQRLRRGGQPIAGRTGVAGSLSATAASARRSRRQPGNPLPTPPHIRRTATPGPTPRVPRKRGTDECSPCAVTTAHSQTRKGPDRNGRALRVSVSLPQRPNRRQVRRGGGVGALENEDRVGPFSWASTSTICPGRISPNRIFSLSASSMSR